MEDVEITEEQYENALKAVQNRMVKMPDGTFSTTRDERLPDGRWIKYEIKGDTREAVAQKASMTEMFVITSTATVSEDGWYKDGEEWLEWSIKVLTE